MKICGGRTRVGNRDASEAPGLSEVVWAIGEILSFVVTAT